MNTERYLEELKKLCAIDSGHFNKEGTEAMADYFTARYEKLGLKVERKYYDNNDFAPFIQVETKPGAPIDVLMVAHMDTVFPVGEGAARPFSVDENGIGHGPGCVDCKGGCLMIAELVEELLAEGCELNLCVAMNSDEERGSKYSKPYFEELAQRSRNCLIFEPGRANDEFVSQRKRGANYLMKVHGIAAHSGVNPQDGASAVVEMARWIPQLQDLNDYEGGTSLNIGRINGGGNNGQVPDYCEITISFRCLDPEAPKKLDALFEKMKKPYDPRTSIEVEQVSLRPEMMLHEQSKKLLQLLEETGKAEDIPVTHLTTGGGSDGNWIAHYGVATMDGCGPCGADLHTVKEYLKVASLEPRFRLMKKLIEKL